ncbi:predicted protein [Verticillium alfalfae VaMs.102]|uniref:Predicted protein n=1 Tax=Verticillium alfalfae (strain VaMs.102 / ATCC MYA-4576 / FGSC 10136) TaxID=526221 RepID=C9S8U6_VERA1|nr:predicted protein [Verticillium alfalfae VaMs.102]EEY14023.1 predicted protein [Verticillium alfalfae VaMs.102]
MSHYMSEHPEQRRPLLRCPAVELSGWLFCLSSAMAAPPAPIMPNNIASTRLVCSWNDRLRMGHSRAGAGMAVAIETVRIISDVGRGSVWCGGMTDDVIEPHRGSSARNPPGQDELTLNVSMGATSAGCVLLRLMTTPSSTAANWDIRATVSLLALPCGSLEADDGQRG